MPLLMDGYLRQAEPLFRTYGKNLCQLANKNLVMCQNNAKSYPFQRIEITIEFSALISVVPANEVVEPMPIEAMEPMPIEAMEPMPIEAMEPTANEAMVASRNKNEPDFFQILNLMEFILLYNERLKSVVLQALLAENVLMGKNSSLSRKVNKLTELKDCLETFSEIVEKVHAFYSAKSLGLRSNVNLPPFDEIKKAKDVIRVLKNKLTLNELSSWINEYCVDGLRTSDDAIICTILGLSEDVSNWLSELDLDVRTHESILYFIQKAMDVATEESGADDIAHGKPYLLGSLLHFGFTQSTADTLCLNIPDDIVDLQTPAFWAKRYLDHAYTYHPLLKTCPRYPYRADIVDDWFMADVTQGSGEDTDKYGKVYMINLSVPMEKTVSAADLAKLLEPGDEYQLLFHGTTHDSAVSIITDGIILTQGGKKQDFSSGDGFYLSEDFENANVWRRAGRGGHQAVIVYKIKRSLLDVKEQCGLDLAQNKTQWEDVVLCCRNGYKNRKSKKALECFTFIRGPLCLNPQKLGRERPSGFGRETMQLCIRDEDYAETFGNLENIGCVVFY